MPHSEVEPWEGEDGNCPGKCGCPLKAQEEKGEICTDMGLNYSRIICGLPLPKVTQTGTFDNQSPIFK